MSIGFPISQAATAHIALAIETPSPGNAVHESLADRLKWARKRAKLSQQRLADAVGMTQPTYSELESGRSKTTSLVASLADALNVRALWLERGTGSPDTGAVREAPQTYETAPTARELALLARFRALSSRRQAALLELIASD